MAKEKEARTWMRKEELEFISQITADVPCGGPLRGG